MDEAKLADIPVFVYGNKSDPMNAMEQCEIEEVRGARAQGAQLAPVVSSARRRRAAVTGRRLNDYVHQINKGE